MKIKLRRLFRYMDGTQTREIPPGVHDLPKELAEKALRFGKAERVAEKKAPENKLRGDAPENKSKVVKKRRRRTGSKSKS